MTEVFRSSLFGYSKKSVSEYIVAMNEEFTRKLLEKDMECQETVRQLKEQLENLQDENAQLRAGRQEIADALIDARTFASELMAQAEAENNAQRAKNTAYHQAELQRLHELASNIDTLRNALRSAIVNMDAELERYRLECQAAQACELDSNSIAVES